MLIYYCLTLELLAELYVVLIHHCLFTELLAEVCVVLIHYCLVYEALRGSSRGVDSSLSCSRSFWQKFTYYSYDQVSAVPKEIPIMNFLNGDLDNSMSHEVFGESL